VHLLVVPSSSVFDAIAQSAAQLDSAEIIAGLSSVMPAREQARLMGVAWEKLVNRPSRPVTFRVIDPEGTIEDFSLGAHPPRLTQQEIDLIHEIWLDFSEQEGLQGLEHRDVVAIALERLERDLKKESRPQVLEELRGLPRR
jgi:hypothetical protein